MFSELIREKIIRKLGDELPHDTFVEIDLIKDKKVFLKTWVKVKKNWNTDSGFIQSLGVGGNYESK